MDDMDILWLVLYGAACFGLGRWYQIQVMIRNLVRNTDRLRELLDRYAEEDAEEEGSVVAVDAEWVKGQVYLYRKDTGEFLGQGKSIDEAIMSVSQQHKGNYLIDKETVDKIRAELPNA